MLHFITGRPGSGKSTLLLEKLTAHLSAGGKAVLLVPEQQAVFWETRLAETLPPEMWLRLEVTNFTRLANTVFRMYGGLSLPRIDEGGRALVLWRAMLSVWDMLKVYSHGADGREDKNIPSLLSAVAECKQNGVSPAQLEQAAEALTEEGECGSFADRLGDVSLVYSAYESLLHEEYNDREDIMSGLCRKLESAPYFRDKAVFVDSFYSVTAQEIRILRTIAASALSMTVTFACDRNDTGEIPFLRIRKFLDQMEGIAADTGKTPAYTELTTDRRHGNAPALAAVSAGLFRYDMPLPAAEELPDDDSIRVIRCGDRYEECEAACALIEEKIRAGCRYRDIALVARNMDSLRGILDTAMERHGIPCFLAASDPLAQSPAVRLVQSLLAIEAGSYNRRDFLRLIATGLTPLTDTECDCFAAYTKTWNIRGRRMFCGESEDYRWSWNPDGYRIEMSRWGKACLRYANSAREKIVPPVAAFSAIFADKSAPVEEICRGIVAFCREMQVYERLAEQAQALRREGKREEADKTERVWQTICDALDKMVEILGGTSLEAGRFSGLFGRVIASMDIGAIPTGMDEVLMGSANGVRFGEVRHVIMLDACEGIFPGNPGDNGFFRDTDRIFLEGVGVNLGSDRVEEYVAEEYWMFYRTAASAVETLSVLSPASIEGEGYALSPGAARLLAISGKEAVNFRDLPPEKRIYHPAARVPITSAEMKNAMEALRNKPFFHEMGLSADEDACDPAYSAELFGNTMGLTQSRLDRFSSCPFAYWCTYGMTLHEEAKAEITSPDIGSFVHAILEQFFRMTGGRKYPLPEEETKAIAEELIGAYLYRLGVGEDNGRLTYLFGRLRRNVMVFLEAVMREFAQGKFAPAAFELPVGLPAEKGGDSVKPVAVTLPDGTSVVLRGIIDRVDTYTKENGEMCIRVVDYKTGSRSFSLAEVRDGLHVQLLIYLFSLWKSRAPLPFADSEAPTAIIPAGAVYFNVKPGEKSADAPLDAETAREQAIDGITRSGVYLKDEEVLDAMDAGLSGKYVPVTRKKDGGLTGRATLQDLEQFGNLYGQMRETVEKIAGEMKNGISCATPKTRNGTSPCSYCSMRPVCRVR
ncbi:MAG: PD-(D/E)XK nuclease family protein [Clostridia bacterium]|nr:PD-(D/E)XK nuclease family protein [Clostridia bacterium]